MTKPARYLSARQVAAELGLHPESVRRLLRAGKLPGCRMGGRWRTRRIDLENKASNNDPENEKED